MHETATAGTFDHFRHSDGVFMCEDVSAEDLVAQYGTPLYVYSENAIRTRYRSFVEAFAPLDPLIAYSVKANGNLEVLRILESEGAGADIVSGGELYRAVKAGIRPDRIVFSGVGKTLPELAAGLDAGIYSFNVESAGELHALDDLARTLGVRAPIALRVNPDVDSPTPHHYTATGGKTTKFGIPYHEAEALYRKAATMRGIALKGIDVHIGSQILDVEPYRLAVERVLDLVARLRRDGIELEFLDVGGGFGVEYEDGRGPGPQEFADTLVPLLASSGLRTVFEPGRYIVGPAGVLLARVIYVKEMSGKTFVITDAGMNDLLRPSHYASYHGIVPARFYENRAITRVDVVGPICESGDFLALDRPIDRPEPGELLVINTTGAYGFSMASTYNQRTRPAEIVVNNNTHRLARRRETYEDLLRGEADLG
jgi:diaminopimelate decarboxylase